VRDLARQGSCKTCQCEFGLGNRGFARVAMDTVSRSNSLTVAVQTQTRRRQRKRTCCSTVSTINQEGRASQVCAKTIMAPYAESISGAASSVSRRSHVGKVLQGNLGDPMMSRVVTQPTCLTALVDSTISKCEGLINASWGVGEAHSIGEGGDSITLPKRRSLACMRGCFEFMNESILPRGSRRISFI
jgi:hypothetical protein